ncbi:porin [Hydromonas duriensis]|uniref:Putative porin n=1 Tax=Hydromonas duriensis TaxID=1527608 RepID=A0A4R6Y780_9BURK|nr:porin [Hydromonas duriensis]TDR31172.1 putative porin [Hydromonas duriensis]
MKKTLIALGLLGAYGAVHAESSVTLYGNINVAVTKKGDAGVTLKAQEYRYASHIGVTGKEDLGNGYSAIFKLEGELEPDTGSGVYGADKKTFGFNRHSYIGLVTPFGAFRFGRSTTPFVNMWIGGGFGEGRGIGEFTGGLAGTGLRTTQPEVGARWNNALFYDVKKGGFAAGFAVTTKGSESIVPTTVGASSVVTSVDNEGASGTKSAYGGYARYEGKAGMWGYKVGAAYQVDNGSTYSGYVSPALVGANLKNAPAEAKNAWIVASGLSYGAAKFDIGYAKAKIDNTDITNANLLRGKSKTLFASLGYDLSARDHVYFSYGKYKRNNDYTFATGRTGVNITSVGEVSGEQYSAGYEHQLSKRTVVYANIRKVTNVTNSCSANLLGSSLSESSPYYKPTCGAVKDRVQALLDVEKGWSYDVGVSHKF